MEIRRVGGRNFTRFIPDLIIHFCISRVYSAQFDFRRSEERHRIIASEFHFIIGIIKAYIDWKSLNKEFFIFPVIESSGTIEQAKWSINRWLRRTIPCYFESYPFKIHSFLQWKRKF